MIKKAADLQPVSYQNRFGGQGEVRMKNLLTAAEFCGKGRLFAHNVILPGSSIGFHQHHGDFETYYVLKGEGTINDNGVKSPVRAGDVIYTKNGESHGLENTGTENLEVMALVLFD